MTSFMTIDSPIGPLTLLASDGELTGLYMDDQRYAPDAPQTWKSDRSAFGDAVAQLNAYFAKELQEFDLPLRPSGSPFHLAVWNELTRIPYGQSTSYGDVARRVGTPSAYRAVGRANGRNPIAIVIPCHRVIGSNGSLTGYGGGLDRKRWLLSHESSGVQQTLAY